MSIIYAGEKTLERERGRALTSLSWSEFVEPRKKVYLLDEGYAWVSKSRDFTEDLRNEFGKSKVSGFGSVNETS